MGTKNRTREYGGGYGLVGAEFWWGWGWLGRVLGGGGVGWGRVLGCVGLGYGRIWAVLVLVLGDFSWWGEKICCDWTKL